MCFACLDASVAIMVRDLSKSRCLLAPKDNVQTAKWPRLKRFAAGAVKTFPSGIISLVAIFVISQNALAVRLFQNAPSATGNSATIAKIPSSVESAAWNFATIAIAIGYIAVNANRHFVLIAKICSSVADVKSHSATTARICRPVACVASHSATTARTPPSGPVASANSHSVPTAR